MARKALNTEKIFVVAEAHTATFQGYQHYAYNIGALGLITLCWATFVIVSAISRGVRPSEWMHLRRVSGPSSDLSTPNKTLQCGIRQVYMDRGFLVLYGTQLGTLDVYHCHS